MSSFVKSMKEIGYLAFKSRKKKKLMRRGWKGNVSVRLNALLRRRLRMISTICARFSPLRRSNKTSSSKKN